MVGLHDPGSPSPGEIGGMFAGVVTVLGLIGAGLRWLLNWTERRASGRAAKLQIWHEELAKREAVFEERRAEFEERLESRVDELQRENQVWRLAFQMVAIPLRNLDPRNPALARVEQLLVSAIPLDPDLADEMRSLLASITE